MTTNWLDAYKSLRLPPLKAGKHDDPSDGLCAMEMVAFLERLPHSDHPPCTCPIIGGFVRGLNDALDDDERERLLPYLPRLVGTVSFKHSAARGRAAVLDALTQFLVPALGHLPGARLKSLCEELVMTGNVRILDGIRERIEYLNACALPRRQVASFDYSKSFLSAVGVDGKSVVMASMVQVAATISAFAEERELIQQAIVWRDYIIEDGLLTHNGDVGDFASKLFTQAIEKIDDVLYSTYQAHRERYDAQRAALIDQAFALLERFLAIGGEQQAPRWEAARVTELAALVP
jgi:hypothetical protein